MKYTVSAGDEVKIVSGYSATRHPYGMTWIAFNQPKVAELANNRALGMQALRVLFFLLATMDRQNRVDQDVRVIADSLAMQQSAVYQALAALKSQNLITIERLRRRVIVVDFHLGWRGSKKELQARYAAAHEQRAA